MKQFLVIPLFIASMAFLIGFKKNDHADHRTDATSTELSIADVQIVEGNAGQNSVEVMVSISEVTTAPVTVAYTTKDGTATDSSDYLRAEGSVTFTPGEMVKWIKVLIIGEVVCEDDEKFEIILSNASGATLKDKAGTVTIINDDCRRGSMSGSIPGGTTPPTPTGNVSFSVYEVRLTHTGYATLAGSASDCGVRSNGKVVLTGLLAGAENVGADDDIVYKGVLQMDMNIDICSVTRLLNGEDKQCAITVVGSGPVTTELEIQFDHRGGYIKIEHKSGLFLKNLFGTCDNAQIHDEWDMVPNKTIASIFNGYELPMLTDRTLRVGRYVDRGDEGETVVEVLRVVRH
jgi:hypothetical protein